ncbi:hypothetical protein ACIQUC_15720 [Curtobacterium sp. NPDC098951]|uniref:hypothetical protein n=1 Tax=Curtobacterium sp. NPDC098951 TaxID=3363974 RepID=UPI0038047E66
MTMTLFLGLPLLVFLAAGHWAHGVSEAARGGAAIVSNDAALGGLGQYLPSASIALVVLVLPSLTVWRAGFGARLAWPGPHRIARTVRGSVVYALIFTGVGTIAAWVTRETGTEVRSVGEVYGSFGWGARLASSVWAGLWEETIDVALPIGVTFALVTIYRTLRGRGTAHNEVPRWCYLAGIFGLITRFTDHLYQGPVAAAFVVLAGVGAVIVFARYGSVVPLILGHFAYDVVVAGAPVGLVLPAAVMVAIGAATFVPTMIRRSLAWTV